MRTEFDAISIADFLHHAHFIPASKGLLRKWMEENAPGWNPEDLLTALVDAGAVERESIASGWTRVEGVDHVTLSRNPSDPRSTP